MITRFRKYWEKVGPGIVTGAADDDPSGIATFSQTGAQYGLTFLWTALFTFPFMAVIQEMCGRIGIVVNRGLAGTIRKYCPPSVLYLTTLCLIIANTFNIGADISAIGEATQLLFPEFSVASIVIFFTVFTLLLQILIPYQQYARYLKYLSFVLIVYILAGIMIDVDWKLALQATVFPKFDITKDSILLLCALLGTSISPYLFFWQTSQEVEEKLVRKVEAKTSHEQKSKEIHKEVIHTMRFDIWSGMFFSNLTMFFIIAVCGTILFSNGISDIQTAGEAAQALLPFAGKATYLLFTLGILGTGLLAVPILAGSSAYAIAETFRFREGLYNKYHEAKAFYMVIVISLVLGLLMTFIGIKPMKALIYAAIVNGIIAPILLTVIVYLADSEKVMGVWKNTKMQSISGWFITGVMTIASGASLWYLL